MYTLIDGVRMSEKHKDTFIIPSPEEIKSLVVGDFVKVGFQEEGKTTERMWVLISAINGDALEGTLSNDPDNLDSIKCDDEVKFKTRNILGVLERPL